jgi:hypothetical protein
MPTPESVHAPRPRWWLPPLAVLCLLGPGVRPEPAEAQGSGFRAWTPLLTWATEARLRFQRNTGDSVGGDNYGAYEIVGRMGERMLREMGPTRLAQALAIKSVFDSLRLDTDVSLDPEQPGFVLIMVRNPFNRDAASVGYFYWYRQEELRVQGVLFNGGVAPRSRVWWTADPRAPYRWGVIDQTRGDPPVIGLTYLRLDANGHFWNLIQFSADTLNLGGPGHAVWTDINRDGVPELVTWIRGEMDSTFVNCAGCPQLIVERTFVERRNGFQLEESRLVPTSFANLALFVRRLQDRDHTGARRLVADADLVDRALEYGWNRRGAGLWRFEQAEPGERWPRWMAFSVPDRNGRRTTYNIHFGYEDGRWIIMDIVPVRAPPVRREERP